MESELRFPDLDAAALQRVVVGLLRRTKVRDVDVLVRLEHFGEAKGDPRSRRAGHLEARPSDHVLSKIEHIGAVRSLPDFLGFELGYLANLGFVLRNYRHVSYGQRVHRRPRSFGKTWIAPAWKLQASVEILAHQRVVQEDRAGRCL